LAPATEGDVHPLEKQYPPIDGNALLDDIDQTKIAREKEKGERLTRGRPWFA
jgi:hypothetical protein